jgi:hypothetical protein
VTHAHRNPADLLKGALKPAPECLQPDRYGETLSASEQAHVGACMRCQTELKLFTEFQSSIPSHDEDAAVQWITRELRRRKGGAKPQSATAAARRSWWSGVFTWRLMPAAAGLAIAVIVSYVAWDREPSLRDPSGQTSVYRTTELKVVGPIGETKVAPSTLEWTSAAGIVQYDVILQEVDGAEVWRTSTPGTRVVLPKSVQNLLVPGKTLLWKVTGRDSAGVTIAESGTQQFRVGL